MIKWTRRAFVGGLSASLCASKKAAAQQKSGGLALWYGSLPKDGSMRFPSAMAAWARWCSAGGRRAAQLNEDTLWAAPRGSGTIPMPQHLPEVRRLVLEKQDYVGADRVCKQNAGAVQRSPICVSATCTSRLSTRPDGAISPRAGPG